MVQEITKKYKYVIEILEPSGYITKDNALLLNWLKDCWIVLQCALMLGMEENLDYFV